MVDWIEAVADWLNPIYGRMRQTLEGDYLQADETPVRFMDPDQKKETTGLSAIVDRQRRCLTGA